MKKILKWGCVGLLAVILFFVAFGIKAKVFPDKPSLSKARLNEAKAFCEAQGFSTNRAVFVDYGAAFNSKRLLVVDLNTGKTLYRCMALRGLGNAKSWMKRFGNTPESNLTSLGKYRVGIRRMMRTINGLVSVEGLGIPCYELWGLEESNSNAHRRGILLHGYVDSFVSAFFPAYTAGCIAVANKDFPVVGKYIKEADKPVLLWAYKD